ncbi:glycosyltransferase [Granulosicoccus antarcticus]|uniref:N-acetylglucosaminyl-diphospho-decaprenol L-rhamnosyltransferase n=1 Tax=Granulosicoccus antarcticus IMCC3135 TaxID=1192854 RepID=A0A2Z2NSA5_9GAMM|nr:glycosyltransferase [Granulosicoccus antarcticus]ASJ71620.1 N-acetylglucosaminyl-diphospho-decaprenol L-rhamnosyltransferase [Granulosicoccus antarcticus IMCC3135]
MKLSALMLGALGRKRRSVPVVNTLKGSIDLCHGHSASGWAIDNTVPEQALHVRLMNGTSELAEGFADLYRSDLVGKVSANGVHGFNLHLDSYVDTRLNLHLTLEEVGTGRVIAQLGAATEPSKSAIVTIEEFSPAGIAGHVIQGSDPISSGAVVCIYADGAFVASVGCQPVEAKEGFFSYTVAVPPNLHDGNPHVFEATMAHQHSQCQWAVDILPAIPTPWSVIQDSSRQVGYAGLSRRAAARYEALRLQLARTSRPSTSDKLEKSPGKNSPGTANWDSDQLGHISLAHDVLVEGHEGRRCFPPLHLPVWDAPEVSIIIPVHNQFALTYQCIASLVLCSNELSFEVIIVDDVSTDQTVDIKQIIMNARVIRNSENLGFLHNCNNAAHSAVGEYLVFLNNDTEVTAGWLDELRDIFRRFHNVGAAGSALVYADGTLQDAGGIVWDSGVPWNVGHGKNPADPAYRYVRDVDYLTGAALMVSQSAWKQVGGFSEEFAPAYYEDTDLAFKLHAAGLRTMYCPHSTVIHFEGQSNGISTDQGIKRFQLVNANKFVEKWQHAFEGNGVEGENLTLHQDRNCSLRVLMVDHAFPCIGQDAGSYAAVQEMRMMIALGCKITFVPHNFQHMGRHTEYLQRLGVECIHAPFYTSVEQVLLQRGQDFDAVYVTRYDVAERIIPHIRKYTSAKILFNNADLHFLRELRAVIAKGESDFSIPRQTRDREVAVMEEVDAILSYNETEHTVIASHLMQVDKIFTCPWVLESKDRGIGFEKRSGVAFLGGFGHPPNREAVEYYLDEVMPLIRKRRPDIKLHIWGSKIPDEFFQLVDDQVIVEGFAESLDEVFEGCRVFIAPLQSGAGIKGKVLDSIAYGVPSVLSPIAAEATGLVDNKSTLIANTPEQWAEYVIQLHDDEVLWKGLAAESGKLTHSRYGFETGVCMMRMVFQSVGLLMDTASEVRRA